MNKENMSRENMVNSPQPVGYRAWLAVISVALAIFAVVSAEILPIGLLTPIAHSLDQSVGQSSLIISLPSWIAAITAPCVVLFFNRINRRGLLLFFMLLLLGSNLMAAWVTHFHWLLFARILFGISMGGIWCMAGSLAIRLVPLHAVGLATSIIFSGIAAASVLGVPLGVYLGDLWGWRFAFICIAVMVAIVFLMLYWSLPSLATDPTTHWSSSLRVLKQKNILFGLAITVFMVMAQFSAYTFIRPLLQSVSQFSDQHISTLLLVYGFFGILGNFTAGYFAQKYLWQTLCTISVFTGLSLLLFAAYGNSQSISIVLLLVWGMAYGGVSVSLMTWMMRAAPKQVEIASAFNISMFNLSIGLGAFTGGFIVDHMGLQQNLMSAAILSAIAACIIALCVKTRNQPHI
ncbi:MFS transporter [Acinetobacter rudis]|uniref:MFS transporter n=1 Tax=Acinetobacter rudis TaxID=632955 RepID=UPI00281028AE|nr:MFS transporter [Acinetobacter rudis]MDQ8952557.1 MFS transporter [Acinetobacter rudis]